MGYCKTCHAPIEGMKQYCEYCSHQRSSSAYQNSRAKNGGVAGSFTPDEWQTLCRKYDFTCLRCGEKGGYLSPDHIIPIGDGGTNSIDNIQPLCQNCNSYKSVAYIDYRIEDLEKRRLRWDYLQHMKSGGQNKGMHYTFSISLSGPLLDMLYMHFLEQSVHPTRDDIQRLARKWIYQDLRSRAIIDKKMEQH